MKPLWQPLRLGILAIALGGGLYSFSRVLQRGSATAVVQASLPPSFPASIALPNWQQTSTQELPTQLPPSEGQPDAVNNAANRDKTSEIKAAREYQYQRQNQPLKVELRQMVSDGNISRYLFVYKKADIGVANAKLQVRYRPGLGHYGVLVHNDTAYLTACINPQGETTANEAQFQNNLSSGVSPARIVGAALGMGSMGDYRCLWTLMSVPLKVGATSITEEAGVKLLEEAWVPWGEQWRANFPNG